MLRSRWMVQRGSWRWAARIAEFTAWGTTALTFLILQLAALDPSDYRRGILAVGAFALWSFLLFRVVVPRTHADRRFFWPAVVITLALTTFAFSVLHDSVPSAALLFVPVLIGIGTLGTLRDSVIAALVAVGAYALVEVASEEASDSAVIAFNAGILMLAGAVAGLVSEELRSHFLAEQEEHRLATAVRLRLMAVLDSVDEAIVFSDRLGIVRVMNRRAADLFQTSANAYLGTPVVQLFRHIARLTEDPEGFMEAFQEIREDPESELRFKLEQILPERRHLRLLSSPTHDETGTFAGRIDVYTDETESVLRAREVERLYEDARKTAENYQRSLLPSDLPRLPRVAMVAHYVAAAGARAVCGDFYDFLSLSDGRVALVVGDVCGIGPSAASDAALTRYSLRSFATEISGPVPLLRWLNSYLAGQLGPERFVRLLVCVLDPERAILEYVNAGHVPPIVFRARRGEAERLEEGGLPLGVEEDVDFKIARVELDAGDTIVLYTDGLTEAPRNGRPLGQGKLSDLVIEYGVGTPGELVQALRRAVENWTEGKLRDDIALLVCQIVPDAVIDEPIRELVVPNEPARVGEIRRFVGSFLVDIRAPVETSSEILIAVGEAAANAWRHGRKPEGPNEVRVRCVVEGEKVRVSIVDDGPGFDVSAEGMGLPDAFASGGRGLYLMRELVDQMSVQSSPGGTEVTLERGVR